jgi:hypothetical protein
MPTPFRRPSGIQGPIPGILPSSDHSAIRFRENFFRSFLLPVEPYAVKQNFATSLKLN